MRIAFLTLSSILLVGCSALFVTAPPSMPPRDAEPLCTTSAAAPIVDVVVSGFQVVRTGLALGASEADYADFPISRGADIGIGATLAVIFAASAAYGFSSTASCEEQKREFHARASEPAHPAPWSGPAPAAAPARPPVPSVAECTFDAQCPEARVCERGRCVPFHPQAVP